MGIYLRMRSARVSLHSVWKAFDEAEFGTKNILNLRESLPSAADARHRAEAWLRERQVSRSSEVLLITGRGNQSPDGISTVRAAIVALLPALRRRCLMARLRHGLSGDDPGRARPRGGNRGGSRIRSRPKETRASSRGDPRR